MSNDRRASDEERGTRIDLAIESAVREMLDVDPPADLRRRVLARIEQDPVASALNPVASAFRRKDLFTRKTVWIPVAAAAALVIAIMLPSRSTSPVPARVIVRGGADRNLAAETLQPQIVRSATPTASSTPRLAVKQGRSRADERSSRRVASAAIADPSRAADGSSPGIEPLAPIAPITVAPVRPADITPPQITVAPLEPIPAIQVAPLFPPERRN